jgi:hypothetical protein
MNPIAIGKIHVSTGYGTTIPDRFPGYERIFLKVSNDRCFEHISISKSDGKFPGR